jgi:superfamily II DNA or RNA helicase
MEALAETIAEDARTEPDRDAPRPTLRPYQVRLLDAIFTGWDAGLSRVAISMATGGGKSVVFAEVARRHLAAHPDAGPVVLLTHRRELVEQAAGHFRRAAPDLRVLEVIGSPGPYGSAKRTSTVRRWRRADILATSVQTLASVNTRDVFPDPSLVIVDESHHAMAQSWTTVLTALGAFSGNTRALGVTATPFREDHRSFSDVWQAIVASVDISWLIAHGLDAEGNEVPVAPGHGYLVPPDLRHLTIDGLNLADVPTSRRSGAVDYRETELADAMEEAGAFDIVAQAVVSELPGRKGAVFAPTVASSQALAGRLTALGQRAEHLDGETPKPERKAMLDRFRAGTTRWLCNVGIISEGFDVPDMDAVVLARPTRSRIFFRQSVGRALRPSPGKTGAIVLDVVGASDGHTLAGVESLTDADVLDSVAGEGLTELLSRSERARAGRADRIAAHIRDARDVQTRAEHTVEQISVTAEGMREALPGLATFPERARAALHPVLDHTTAVTDQESPAVLEHSGAMTLDELGRIERVCADEVAAAHKRLAELDTLKDLMRQALAELREDPEGEVARALVTGRVATVRGQLFGEAEEWIRPAAPGHAGALQVRGGGRNARPTHPARVGWLLRSPAGHLFAPIQIPDPADPRHATAYGTTEVYAGERRPDGLVVAAALPGGRWFPVTWSSVDQNVTEIGRTLSDESDAYRLVVEYAMENTAAPNLLNPGSAWRRKPSPTGNGARAMARRVAPNAEIPDDATAGYVSDVISMGKFGHVVDRLASWVATQTATMSTSSSPAQNGTSA